MNTRWLSKTITEYQRRFGDLEKNLNFNVYLRDKYGSFDNLCKACLKANKSISELEPILSKLDT